MTAQIIDFKTGKLKVETEPQKCSFCGSEKTSDNPMCDNGVDGAGHRNVCLKCIDKFKTFVDNGSNIAV
jgi:hypothetical protein